jgi:MoxR-like ATPase
MVKGDFPVKDQGKSAKDQGKDIKGQEKDTKDQSAKDQSAKDRSVKDQSAKDQSVKDQSAKDQSAKDRSAKDQSAKDQSAKDQSAKDRSVKDQSAKDQSAKDQSAKDHDTKDQSVKDQKKAAKGTAAKDQRKGVKDQGKGAQGENVKDQNLGAQGKVIQGKGVVEVGSVAIHLCEPDQIDAEWIGQEDLVRQLRAAWKTQGSELPMNPRIVGRPGSGKTTLACAVARSLSQALYLFQATADTRPEDLIITPVIGSGNSIRYMASSIVSAMICGGTVILDEGNRMSEKSWASLAPLLDRRRYVESVVAGIKIHAHPDFRFCTTMNEDMSTFDLPEYIQSRLQPQIFVDFSDRDEELAILRQNLPATDREILEYVADFLQVAHEREQECSIRDGINIAHYAGLLRQEYPELATPLRVQQSARMVLGQRVGQYFLREL